MPLLGAVECGSILRQHGGIAFDEARAVGDADYLIGVVGQVGRNAVGEVAHLVVPGNRHFHTGVADVTAANTLSLSELPAGVYLLRTSTTTAKLAK